MIAAYEDVDRPERFDSPRQYGLSQVHKHLPEMTKVTGIDFPPLFDPIVAPFYAGMVVALPVHNRLMLKKYTAEDLQKVYEEHYEGSKIIKVMPFGGESLKDAGYLDASALAGKDTLEIYIFGNEERSLICSRFDNLGKGASGAAIQNMNIMLSIDETKGLAL